MAMFPLTGDVQIGKTRWLERLAELARGGRRACWHSGAWWRVRSVRRRTGAGQVVAF